MKIERVAILFDDTARPETTGIYCRRALEQMVSVQHFLPAQISRIPTQDFDLYLSVDDGLRYCGRPDLHPSAYWAIDTHMDFDWAVQKAREFDFVFAAQKDGVAKLVQSGIRSARWLPLACDPVIHSRHEVPYQFDVCFVGNLFPGPRQGLVELIQNRFQRVFVGQRYFEEMARTYSESRIALNRSVRNDVNMRVFEVLSCGTLLMTNDLAENGQSELFRDGVHLATYRSADELLDKLTYYLQHDDTCKRVAETGRAEVLAWHTYRHRMQTILDAVERGSSLSLSVVTAPQLVQAQETTPLPTLTQTDTSEKPECTGKENKSRCSTDASAPVPDTSYFDFSRPEVAELVPRTASRILDVGCGAGRLGESIKTRQAAEVVGVELNAKAANAARKRLDELHVGNIESDEIDFPEGRFDCVICADILEHLREPTKLLKRLHRWLAPGGTLVASIPNVRNHSLIQPLLDGNWTYESAGLLDHDHVRFFTRREIEKLFYRENFRITEMRFVANQGYSDWDRMGRPTRVLLGNFQINVASSEDAEEFFAYQYLVTARVEPRPNLGMTSIILLTFNQLEYTRLCIDSIRLRTDEPYELIVVDNASTDGTVEWIRSQRDIQLIANRENRGFPAGANQGLAAARGDHLLLLNNDTLVTTGWLRRLLAGLHRDPSIGLIGPVSNNVSGYQQVEIGYEQLESLDGWSWDWGKRHDGEACEVDRLIGFCLLFKREVLDRIGFLDERFGIGCYEDDDYCRRAREAGFRMVVARDAFIHHFGGRTFIGSGVDFAGIMQENHEKYEAKWSGTAANAQTPQDKSVSELALDGGLGDQGAPKEAPEQSLLSVQGLSASAEAPLPPWPPANIPRSFHLERSARGGLLIKPTVKRLSLCMIVRDNEATIGPCLESARPWFDEIVVVDTGSKDRTPEICRQYGAQMFFFPWCDDFSAARNESLRHAEGEWIFWMDSDDTLPQDCGVRLRQLADGTHSPDVLGYVMQVHCPTLSRLGLPELTVVDHVKLFRNRPDLRFEGRIHEQILPAIRRAGKEVLFTDIYVVHSGADHSEESRQHKLERDFRILKKDFEERPNHPFVLFNLGMTYADAKQYPEAIQYLRRSIAVATPGESHLRKAYALLIAAYADNGQYETAEELCCKALNLFPDDEELLFRSGILHHRAGRLDEAERAYLKLLNTGAARYFSSVDAGLAGFKGHQNLALVYEDAQRFADAEAQWRLVIDEQSGYWAGWRGLADLLMRQKKFNDADVVAQQLCVSDRDNLVCEGEILNARLLEARGDVQAARDRLAATVERFSNDPNAHEAYCRILFERGSPAEAKSALQNFLEIHPDDAAALHNLGTVELQQSHLADAIDAYKKSLTHRPNSSCTYLYLGHALSRIGRIQDAVEAWKSVLKLDPLNQEAEQALRSVRI